MNRNDLHSLRKMRLELCLTFYLFLLSPHNLLKTKAGEDRIPLDANRGIFFFLLQATCTRSTLVHEHWTPDIRKSCFTHLLILWQTGQHTLIYLLSSGTRGTERLWWKEGSFSHNENQFSCISSAGWLLLSVDERPNWKHNVIVWFHAGFIFF